VHFSPDHQIKNETNIMEVLKRGSKKVHLIKKHFNSFSDAMLQQTLFAKIKDRFK